MGRAAAAGGDVVGGLAGGGGARGGVLGQGVWEGGGKGARTAGGGVRGLVGVCGAGRVWAAVVVRRGVDGGGELAVRGGGVGAAAG